MKITLRKRDSVTSIILFLFNLMEEIRGSKNISIKKLLMLTRVFGKSESAVRTCLSRMLAQQFLEPVKEGCEIGYRLSASGRQSIEVWNRGLGRCFRRQALRHQDWAGDWHLISLRDFNKSEYANQPVVEQLKEAGLREFSMGLWVSPYMSDTALIQELEKSGTDVWHVVGRINPIEKGNDWMEQIFSLTQLSAQYTEFLKETDALVLAMNEKILRNDGLGMLPVLFNLGWSYFDIAIEDPFLPKAIHSEWIGDIAAKRMRDLRKRMLDQLRTSEF